VINQERQIFVITFVELFKFQPNRKSISIVVYFCLSMSLIFHLIVSQYFLFSKHFRRIAVRQDTYCVAAISLNMVEKVHPVIWTVNNLPFDCQNICPIEKPLGMSLFISNFPLLITNLNMIKHENKTGLLGKLYSGINKH